MIGRVLFRWQGMQWQAILGDDGRWVIPRRRPEHPGLGLARLALERDLNVDLGLDEWSPADGPAGALAISRAAERLRGRGEVAPTPEGPPDRVY